MVRSACISILLALSAGAARAQTDTLIQLAAWPVPPGASELEVDAEGNFWLLYPARNEVHKRYAVSGYDSVAVVGGRGVGGEGFADPRGLQAVGRSEVYLLDYGNQRLVLLTANLRVGRSVEFAQAAVAPPGEDATLFLLPKAFAVSPIGELFVLHQDDNRIYKFDPTGRFELAFGGTTYGAGSTARADGLVPLPGNYLWVPDSSRGEVRVFDNLGNFRALQRSGSRFGGIRPWLQGSVTWLGTRVQVVGPGGQVPLAEAHTPQVVADVAPVGDRLYVLAGDVVLLWSLKRR